MEATTHFLSPFGCIQIRGSHLGLSSVKLVSTRPCPTGPIPPELKPAVIQLNEYFQGKREQFDLRINYGEAPAFYQAVWKELLKIPYGRTTTYQAIAEKLGDSKSVRAVQANRNNPVAIIIPCHRCIAKSGNLQGYFYGLDMKRQLLELENPMSFARQGSLF